MQKKEILNLAEIKKLSLNKLVSKKNKRYFIDLNLFGKSEDEGRTEDPTVYREKKAREEGKVAKSQDLNASFLLMVSVIFLFFWGYFFFNQSKIFVIDFLNSSKDLKQETVYMFLYRGIENYVKLIIPFALFMGFMGFFINFLQVGLLFSLKPISLDFKKVQFKMERFLKIFFSQDAFFNLLKTVIKIFFIAVMCFILLYLSYKNILYLSYQSLENSFIYFSRLSFYLCISVSASFFVLSILDYYYQKFRHKELLKMTRVELKQEKKDIEGNTQVKQRLRQKQEAIMKYNLSREVPKADLVIVNPTHYAVAISYKPEEEMYAPLVIAKGKDIMALKIKELANKHSIHIVENPELAQILYRTVKVGDYIPEEFYQVIAEVLAFVLRSKKQFVI